MNEQFDFEAHRDDGPQPIVYVRPVAVAELPQDIQNEVGDIATLYAVHSEEGERLALVKDKSLAFILARQNDLAPVGVH
ncbi:DUF1150 family protein [Tropicimonas sp. IMCC34011]|uniref:DUF1150 family protein n=1 Tax=Tropicimonas sp. IMCC34011 TaxID=2248759 RepID=UPI000E24A8D0|nr:DUF1150 family protein [Tropicimonas sp. IMCC34011]